MSLHRFDTVDDMECSDSEATGFPILMLLAECFSGLCAVVADVHLSQASDVTVAGGQAFTGAIFAGILSVVVDLNSPRGYDTYLEELASGDLAMFVVVLHLSVLATCVAWWLFFRINKIWGPIKQTTSVYAEMFFSVLEGILLRREWEGTSSTDRGITVFGAVVTFCGVVACLHDEGIKFAFVKHPKIQSSGNSSTSTPIDNASSEHRTPATGLTHRLPSTRHPDTLA
eukprot:c14783_g1_i2.p1 GENE.c14783_g1_i2~~c14783_g1_i2.p1  ORF type:complete len:228 (+),score=46.79 c14783_g1_i2:534-1217(+)